jgi:hypothetical protein
LRPGGDDRPGRPSDGDRPLRPDNRPNRPGGGDWANNRPNRIDDRDRWNNWRENNFTQINNNFQNNWRGREGWYDRDWWNDHRHPDFDWDPDVNWWGWATFGAVTSWLPWGWSQPVSYSYGENVYYQDDSVYYGDQVVATAEEYAQQAEAIATSIPETKPAADDWMPLGVFALTKDGEPTGVDPTLYLQLTVSKQGIIAGTLQNTATNAVQSIEGMVDRETQRAAWTVVGKTRPLMETGIVNLTQDTAPALVHFDDGTTQQWLMVRLEKPQ